MGVWDTAIRSLLAFTTMMIIARILGKGTIAQMTYHDFVASITMGAITANIAFNSTIPLWSLLTAAFTFTGIAYVLMIFAMKNRKLRSWFSGKPTVLIQDGKILENNMKKLKITLDTLNQELREKDVFNILEVQYAILELNGNVSVLRTPESMAVTRKDMHLVVQSKQAFPIELIMDGKIIESNFKQNNITEDWLRSQIELKKLSFDNINYAVISSTGNLYLDELKDQISNPIDIE
ncbi:DUF421 domain-containing protein [Paenibacillus luteus]|uniref:DUF421 domain-containing protein n=1 Tax=Paenibacillus luteus TaxID=2545753 RepID=UPI001143EA5A|nr:DUF421 domain-containing protein [Paenibacillus luteus]